MFRGRHNHTIDTKGRVSIPAGYRMELQKRSGQAPVDAGAEDVEISADVFEIYTAAADLHSVSSTLVDSGLKIAEAELSQIPKNEIELGQKETVQVMSIIEALEDVDDVQRVYSGLSISDEAIAELEAA